MVSYICHKSNKSYIPFGTPEDSFKKNIELSNDPLQKLVRNPFYWQNIILKLPMFTVRKVKIMLEIYRDHPPSQLSKPTWPLNGRCLTRQADHAGAMDVVLCCWMPTAIFSRMFFVIFC